MRENRLFVCAAMDPKSPSTPQGGMSDANEWYKGELGREDNHTTKFLCAVYGKNEAELKVRAPRPARGASRAPDAPAPAHGG